MLFEPREAASARGLRHLPLRSPTSGRALFCIWWNFISAAFCSTGFRWLGPSRDVSAEFAPPCITELCGVECEKIKSFQIATVCSEINMPPMFICCDCSFSGPPGPPQLRWLVEGLFSAFGETLFQLLFVRLDFDGLDLPETFQQSLHLHASQSFVALSVKKSRAFRLQLSAVRSTYIYIYKSHSTYYFNISRFMAGRCLSLGFSVLQAWRASRGGPSQCVGVRYLGPECRL